MSTVTPAPVVSSARPLYLRSRDELADIFGNPAAPVAMRNAARLEFDAKTDAAEGR